MEIPHICRYCGGIVRLVPAENVYGDSAVRLGLKGEKLYQCQNCNARVGCHKGTVRPLGDLANEVLRLKRIETHQVFDAYWMERGMSRLTAQNYYDPACKDIDIPLDIHLSPQENAAKYFKKYTKAKTAEKYLTEQLTRAGAELEYLELSLIHISEPTRRS